MNVDDTEIVVGLTTPQSVLPLLTMEDTRCDIDHLFQQGRSRWLKANEVLFILQNHESNRISPHAPQKPISGSLFLFNKNVLPCFRRDGHNWRKHKHKNSVKEAHERLKVDNVEALNCYYAHGEENRNFQRRSFWMLDQANKHIVLVHYRDITEGKTNSTPIIPEFSPGQSYTLSQSVNSLVIESQGNASLSGHGSYQSLVTEGRCIDHVNELESARNGCTSSNVDVSPMLQVAPVNQKQVVVVDDTSILGCDNSLKELDQVATLQQHEYFYNGSDNVMVFGSTNLVGWQEKGITAWGTNIPDVYSLLSDPGQFQIPQQEDSIVPITREHKFSIRKISPEWGFCNEVTEVTIIGSFVFSPSDQTTWHCMFGDIEVPIQIIQDGVICCQAPPYSPGNVTFYIRSGNREACSEFKNFEYRDRNSTQSHNKHSGPQQENTSMEADELLYNFVQMLLSHSPLRKGEGNNFDIASSSTQNGYGDSRNHGIEAPLKGCGTCSSTIDWALQKLLEDKLQQWLCARLDGVDNLGSTLSEKEQGILHIAAGLGYEWALNPILEAGVGVNFQDTNGWTALHWAARYGREKMANALINSDASPGLVTYPTADDPMPKTPTSIAVENGHKGLAGYLSKLVMTNIHDSLLKFEGAGNCTVCVEASLDASNTSKEGQKYKKQVLVAAKNVGEAAFRTHSLRKRQQREFANGSYVDDYNFPHLHRLGVASRGWKKRKDFFTPLQKVVKTQAQERGNRVRKYHRVISAVMEKVVLRWRRKEGGVPKYKLALHGQKLDTLIMKFVFGVHQFLIDCDARVRYTRMLETFQPDQAKLDVLTNEDSFASLAHLFSMDNYDYDAFQLPLEFSANTPDFSELWA